MMDGAAQLVYFSPYKHTHTKKTFIDFPPLVLPSPA